MGNKFFDLLLRRMPVRRRIIGGFLLILLLAGLASPIILLNLNLLVTRMAQFTSVDAKIERLLLVASRQVTTSQLNLNRYIQDYVPSPYEALDDAEQALQNLKEAQAISTNSNEAETIALIIQSLKEYQQYIADLQKARASGNNDEATRLESKLQKLGNDISVRLELTVNSSVNLVAAKNQEVLIDARQNIGTGLLFMIIGFLLAILLSALVSFSITRPLAELRAGTEAFQQGNLFSRLPEIGADEFTAFAHTFNSLGQQVQELISGLEQRVAERTDALSRKTSQLQAAAQVARQAAAIKDPAGLVNDAVHLISNQFGFYHAGLFLLDEHAEFAVLQATSSEGGKRMLTRGHRLRVGRQGIVGYAASSKQPRIALDTGADAVYFDNPDLPNTRSEAALPLIVRDRVIGVLDIQSEEPQAFTQEDIETFQTLADQLALAIENARLFGEMGATVLQLEQAATRRTRQAWTEITGTKASVIQYTPMGVQDVTGRTGLTSNTDALQIPITLHNQKIGAIKVRRKGDSNWSLREHAMLQEIATQVGLALENARLLNDAQTHAARERAVSEITARIGAAFDVDSILRVTAQEIGKALGDAEVSIRISSQEEK